jgi:hypothetical protein
VLPGDLSHAETFSELLRAFEGAFREVLNELLEVL